MQKRLALLSFVVFVSACSTVISSGSGDDQSSRPGPGPADLSVAAPVDVPPDAAMPPPIDLATNTFIVHEWGTFTSLVGPDGISQPGMFHTEEPLPTFVHSRNAFAMQQWKGLEAPPAGVTQKLETPVLYFHTTKAQQVTVKVDFPKGILSEWYPDASAYAPQVVMNQVPQVASGSMSWKVTLTPGAQGPVVAPDDIWAPSRVVAAMPLSTGAEKEQFIFYRGVGAFDVPLHVTSDATTGKVTVTNGSGDAIASVIVFKVTNTGVSLSPGFALAPMSAATVDPAGASQTANDAAARAAITQALTRSGLYDDEAKAMVDTWARSYFKHPGLRVLYVVPRAWTDALLPIAITPTPDELVRTLVGRIEVLTEADAAALRALVASEAASQKTPAAAALDLTNQVGRTVEAQLRYSVPGIADASVRAFGQQVIAQLATGQ